MEAKGNSRLGNDMRPAVPLVILALLVAHMVSDLTEDIVHRGGAGTILGNVTFGDFALFSCFQIIIDFLAQSTTSNHRHWIP